MPRRFERHKRTSEWYAAPSRSTEVRQATGADPEPARKAPGRKDTRRWCRGKPGVGHAPVLVFRPVLARLACAWRPDWPYEHACWECYHQEECGRCGKVLRTSWQLAAGECPAYPGDPAQRAAAEAECAEIRERVEASRQARRPVVTGPQGYRRRRQANTAAT